VASRVPKWIIRTLAVLALALGAVLFWLPIPLGAPLIAVGAALMVTSSVAARRWLRRVRRRQQSLDHFLEGLEPRLPVALAESLKRTRSSTDDTVDLESLSTDAPDPEPRPERRAQ